MNYGKYLKIEARRALRQRGFFLFSLAIPLLLFYVMTGGRDQADVSGISPAKYYMVSLSVWGAVSAVVAAGTLISTERKAGWNRHLRLTGMRPLGYFTSKTLTAYLVAAPTLAALYIAGATSGVQLPAATWAHMIGWVLLGLLPFAAFGILLGQLLSADSMGSALAGVMVVVGLLGGIWMPISDLPDWLRMLCHSLPSYWVVQAGRAAITGHSLSWTGVTVLAAWTVGLALLAGRVYRHAASRA